jgi:hypothetical protein
MPHRNSQRNQRPWTCLQVPTKNSCSYSTPAQEQTKVVATCENRSHQSLPYLFDDFQPICPGHKNKFDQGLFQTCFHQLQKTLIAIRLQMLQQVLTRSPKRLHKNGGPLPAGVQLAPQTPALSPSGSHQRTKRSTQFVNFRRVRNDSNPLDGYLYSARRFYFIQHSFTRCGEVAVTSDPRMTYGHYLQSGYRMAESKGSV